MKARWARLALVAASIAALTGCVPGADATTSTPLPPITTAGATPTSTPTAGASPEASPQDPADPATWIVSGGGIGPVAIGADIDEFSVVGPYSEHATGCPNPAVRSLAGEGVAPMTVVAVDGGSSVASVHVTSWGTEGTSVVSPRTTEGIRLGSQLGELQATYPAIELTETYGDTMQYARADGAGWVIFTVQDDAVVQLSASTTSSNPAEQCG